ncbi:MAG: PEGA domain-containing protein [Vicinamibacterales bacterium]
MLHQIGIGTLGPVFRTYEPTRDRLVAVKTFRLDITPEQAQSLADALGRAVQASLFHPSIVEPIASGVEGTVAYRAEEYVAAESLDVAMRHYAPAPIEKVLPFITQLAGAVDFARAAGVGHGGLHPRDIFVTPDDARATGFGVVDALEQTGLRAPVRRPYTAPERIHGRPWSTPADVFSLAAITFELLTGRRPAGTGAEIGALPDGERSSAIHGVLARAMGDDPSRRFASALTFADALESAAHGKSESSVVDEIAGAGAIKAREAPPVRVAHVADPHEPPPPGEFEVERQLDAPAARLDDVALTKTQPASEAASRDVELTPEEPTLFDAEPLNGHGDVDDHGLDHPDHDTRAFAHEFAEDEPAEPDLRHDGELAAAQAAIGEERRPRAAEFEMPVEGPASAADASVSARDSGAPLHALSSFDMPESSSSSGLPMALMLIVGLIVGFGGGYFIGSRDRASAPPPAIASTAAPGDTGSASGARPWSDHATTSSAAPASAAASPAATAPRTPPAVPPTTPPPVAREAPPAARPSAAGQIVVKSTPSHAGVVVNGTWRGRTPLTLEHLPFGHYAVRIVQPGYRSAHEELSLGPNEAAHTFDARLEKTAAAAAPETAPAAPTVFTGTLFVDSRPQAATVLLDGRAIGRTPLTLPDVHIGLHVIRIEMTGKKPWSSTVEIIAGQTARVTGSLEDR